MKILVACEESQTVCKEFRALGFEAYSCDILECSGGYPEWHLKGDAVHHLFTKKWDLVIAHPPCTYLSNSGVSWLYSKKKGLNEERYSLMLEGAKFFQRFVLYGKRGGRIAIENPIMHKYAKNEIGIGKANQIIQPWMFGHPESKATCFWLYNLPPLKETKNVKHIFDLLPDNERQKLHYLPPGPERAKLRSKTFKGVAEAMAEQWGNFLINNL